MTGLAVRGLTKRFGPVTALSDVSFHVEPGEIVALLGENGAGKTTLLRVVSGFLRPDGGTVLVDDSAVTLRGPRQAADLGIGMVHQHFLLVPELTVAENVVLGREPGSGPWFDQAAAQDEVRSCAERFGLDVDPRARLGDLPVDAQQRVELLKVLARGARYLLLDEPTGLLPPAAVKDLFALVERLAGEGCGVVLVTHKLREVFSVCRRATVLRRGQVTGVRDVSASDESELAVLMVGEDLDLGGRAREPAEVEPEKLLEVRDLEVAGRGARPAVAGASFAIHAGEVVGLAGVAGSGQTELFEALTGLRSVASGSATLAGRPLAGESVAARRHAGLGYLPADRQGEGLVGGLSVAENLVLSAPPGSPCFRGGLIDAERVRATGADAVREHDVRPPDPAALCETLSGGNQQKVLVARELAHDPRVLLAAEPVRGLDFVATEAVQRRLRALADGGGGVLVSAADLSELLDLCDRILVLFAGRIVGEVRPGATSEDELGRMIAGAVA